MGKSAPTIVVIDDSAEVRSLIKTRLRLSGGLDVVGEGADGTEAIELAHRHQPTLLLLDMSMPRMDGLDALAGILAVSPDTRVVVYSGFEEQGLADRARELGATAFIQKSVSVEMLASQLVDALSIEPGTPIGPPSSPRLTLAPRHTDSAGSPAPTPGEQSVIEEHLERFREVFEEAAIGMATMTLTGGIVRANRALGALMLCPHEELVGLDYARLTDGRGDVLTSALEDITVRAVDLVHLEHEVAGAPDERKVRASLTPVRDSSGQALYVFLQVQDITAQRASEDSLRQSEERFRLLVEAVEDYAIFMLTPHGIVASRNAGAQRSKGYRTEEIIGRHFRAFYPPDKQAEKHPEHELELALQDGSYAEEGWRIRKDGTQFWASVLITAVFNDAGEHIGFAKVTRDVTERRLAEEQREQANEALTRANVSLRELNVRLRQAAVDQSQFLAVTAHELGTPATVLEGSADTLSRHWTELTDDERVGLLDGMTSSAGRLRRLLADLLTAARLEAGALRLNLAPTSLNDLVGGTVDTVRAASPDAEIVVVPGPPVEILADPDRLARAIDNLIVNAFHHGAPPIRIETTTDAATATIRVSDAGPGVRADMHPRLFERFATGDRKDGTGLGLFIVRELARAHGGDAYYEPPIDEQAAGAFVICVPLA